MFIDRLTREEKDFYFHELEKEDRKDIMILYCNRGFLSARDMLRSLARRYGYLFTVRHYSNAK